MPTLNISGPQGESPSLVCPHCSECRPDFRLPAAHLLALCLARGRWAEQSLPFLRRWGLWSPGDPTREPFHHTALVLVMRTLLASPPRPGGADSDQQIWGQKPQPGDTRSTLMMCSGSYQARPKQLHLGSQEGYLLAPELPPPAPRGLWALPGALLLSHVPLGDRCPGQPMVTLGAQHPTSIKGRKGSRTHSRKSKEGDTNEGECGRQEPPIPGLRVLVPVANGCQGDL